MSFWNLSDNTEVNTTGTFESGGGDIEPIPAKTQVKAAIEEAKISEWQGDEYIELRWTVLAPVEYKNRKVFQKVRVFDSDKKKADKAKNMLAAIATNAGEGLLKEEPTDQSLQKHLLNKPMALLLQVWEIEDENTGETKTGNWVSHVSPLNAAKKEPPKKEESVEDELGF